MPLQILRLKLDGITAGDYLTWCRDPEPPALDFALRSVSVDADPLGNTITATLDWNVPAPRPSAAATAAGLPLSAGVEIYASHEGTASTEGARYLTCIHTADERVGSDDAGQRLPRSVGFDQETAASRSRRWWRAGSWQRISTERAVPPLTTGYQIGVLP